MKKNNTGNNGFTLVELSMVMLIFGMIVTTALFAFKIEVIKKNKAHTIEALQDIQVATATYLGILEEYPCPARLAAAPSDADYGVANCATAIRVPVTRDLNGDGTPENLIVAIGAVPFKTLSDNINFLEFTASDAFDGWGNKITYAVTENLTNMLTFNEAHGALNVVDEFSPPEPGSENTILQEEKTAHIVLVSHGPDGVGAYSREGIEVEDCALVLPPEEEEEEEEGPVVGSFIDETENCDHADGLFLSGLLMESKHRYNDDIVRYQIIKSTSLWEYTDVKMDNNGTPGDPSDDFPIPLASNTNIGFIGVGTETPTEKLHVAGDLQAAQILADKYCDQNGQNCMSAESLAGPGMNCTSNGNQAVVAIAENKAICAAIFQPQNLGCTSGQYMVGISNKTGAICAPLP